MSIKIAVIGAGSRSFGPAIIRDIFISDVLDDQGIELALMDIVADHLTDIQSYAGFVAQKLGRKAPVSVTTDLGQALDGARFVICAVDREKLRYWSQDFHVPRKYGFKQVRVR